MEKTEVKQFKVAGISVRTTNENGKAAKDIPELWQKFMRENIAANLKNKIDQNIYCVYTDYESDHNKPYTTLLGCKVSDDTVATEEIMVKTIEPGKYNIQQVKGNLEQGAVYDAWLEIWNKDLSRRYTTDFEVYGEKASNPQDAEIDIFIAVQ